MEQFLGDSVMSDVQVLWWIFCWPGKCRDTAEFFISIDSSTFRQSPVTSISCGKSSLHGCGQVWGEDFVLKDANLIRPVACYALTYMEATGVGDWMDN